MGGCTVIFWVAAPSDDTALVGAASGWKHSVDAPAFAAVACGVAPLHRGLRTVREAATVACEIAVATPQGFAGPASMSDVWSVMAEASLTSRMPQFVSAVLHGIHAAGANEREPLLATVRAYACTGDIGRTAENLFCHRNTVMKRLRRFRDLTGLDMSVPQDAAQAFIALAHAESE